MAARDTGATLLIFTVALTSALGKGRCKKFTHVDKKYFYTPSPRDKPLKQSLLSINSNVNNVIGRKTRLKESIRYHSVNL